MHIGACPQHLSPAAVTSCPRHLNRIYRDRWNFYKMQRYEAQHEQNEEQSTAAAAGSRVPLDGMYFDSSQFLENVQRTRGGGRSLAPVQEEEGRQEEEGEASIAAPSQQDVMKVKKPRSNARVDRAPAAAAGAAALVGVGVGGRGVRVGGEMSSGRSRASRIN